MILDILDILDIFDILDVLDILDILDIIIGQLLFVFKTWTVTYRQTCVVHRNASHLKMYAFSHFYWILLKWQHYSFESKQTILTG